MSYVELFAAGEDGILQSVGEASNNHGYAPIVWEYMGQLYKTTGPGSFYIMMDDTGLKKLWKMATDGELPYLHALVMWGTFDPAYFTPEHFADFAEGLEQAYKEITAWRLGEERWPGAHNA